MAAYPQRASGDLNLSFKLERQKVPSFQQTGDSFILSPFNPARRCVLAHKRCWDVWKAQIASAFGTFNGTPWLPPGATHSSVLNEEVLRFGRTGVGMCGSRLHIHWGIAPVWSSSASSRTFSAGMRGVAQKKDKSCTSSSENKLTNAGFAA